MSNPTKYLPHGSVVFATFSLEQGLLLLANPLCQTMVKSCLARAKHLFPVRLCHFIIHANHVHMIFVVIAPKDACSFIGHFKSEITHRINAIFGWKKRTIWCEGYDSPVVLTPLRALIAISYLYANPAKDDQEESIDDFPGLSSWRMFEKQEHSKIWPYLTRPKFRCIAPTAHNLAGYTREAERLRCSTKETHLFELEPDAWLDAFDITDPQIQEQWNKRLIERVRKFEKRANRIRARKGRRVRGKNGLIAQTMTFNYKSNRSGKRMWCLSESRSVRVAFIDFLKGLKKQAREVYERWHTGDFSVPYPLGLFPPNMPRLVEPLFVW